MGEPIPKPGYVICEPRLIPGCRDMQMFDAGAGEWVRFDSLKVGDALCAIRLGAKFCKPAPPAESAESASHAMNFAEFQTKVGTWHEEVFGPNCPDVFGGLRNDASANFVGFYSNATDQQTAALIIVLLAYAHRMHWDMSSALQAKFDMVSDPSGSDRKGSGEGD